MKAIILCASRGERLKPLTDSIPKPMVPINKIPLLEYTLLLCKKHGIKDIVINTSYLSKKITEYFGDGSKFGVRINYSFEEELLGTSGALNNFRGFFDSDKPFFVIYGDNITDIDMIKMLKYHKEKKAFATLFLHKQEDVDKNTTPGIVVFDANNKITKIIEKPNEEEKKLLKKTPKNQKLSNSGIYILNPKILDFISEGHSDFATNIFPKLIKRGFDFYAYTGKCYFKELGQQKRYNKAKEEIESGKIKLNIF